MVLYYKYNKCIVSLHDNSGEGNEKHEGLSKKKKIKIILKKIEKFKKKSIFKLIQEHFCSVLCVKFNSTERAYPGLRFLDVFPSFLWIL